MSPGNRYTCAVLIYNVLICSVRGGGAARYFHSPWESLQK